jgi:hypothetical protein
LSGAQGNATRKVRRQWEWSGCCGFTFCSNGSTCQALDVEEALYDSGVMRQFVGIDLGCEPAPDETTVCKFLHLLEATRAYSKFP